MALRIQILIVLGIAICGPSLCVAENLREDVSASYEHIVISGPPFARGKSHGIQAKTKILANLNKYKTSPSMPSWEDCINFVQKNYLHALKVYYPDGLKEMEGIAYGANVTLDDIVILNARYDLSRWKRSQDLPKRLKPGKIYKRTPECTDNNLIQVHNNDMEECTGAVALSSTTKNKDVIIGQNWDTDEFILTNDTAILLEVRPDSCDNIKPLVMFTEAGQLGRSGINADGLGILGMSLYSTNDVYTLDPVKYPDGWVPISILRRMFLEAPTFPLGLSAILRTPRHVSVNMIVATAEDVAFNIELTPDEHFITQVPLALEILTHSNHFKSQSFVGRDDIKEGGRGASTLFRDLRVEKHLRQAYPFIDEKSFQEAFKDHVGYPDSVCEHSVPKELAWTSIYPNDATVASIIYNLSKKTMQLTKGPPCIRAYKDYRFSFST